MLSLYLVSHVCGVAVGRMCTTLGNLVLLCLFQVSIRWTLKPFAVFVLCVKRPFTIIQCWSKETQLWIKNFSWPPWWRGLYFEHSPTYSRQFQVDLPLPGSSQKSMDQSCVSFDQHCTCTIGKLRWTRCEALHVHAFTWQTVQIMLHGFTWTCRSQTQTHRVHKGPPVTPHARKHT